jgi:type IX secretion system PorP/SprF family membrane protein
MIQKTVCYLLVFILFGRAEAQQTLTYTQFPTMLYAYNPAYAGMDGVIVANGLYRNQWSGIGGNVISRHIHAHSPFYQWNGGVGISINNQESGVHGHNSIKLSYNYVRVLPSGMIISAGLAGGILQRSLDGRKIRTPGGFYEGGQIVHDDPTLPVSLESGFAPDIDAGIFVAYDRFEAGFSVQQLLGNRIQLQTEERGGFILRRTMSFFSDYEFYEYDDFVFSSAILFRTDLTVYQSDLMVKVQYAQNMNGGISLRGYNALSIDALCLFGNFRVSPSFVVGYSYDVTLSTLKLGSRGSHELILRYTFPGPLGTGKREKIIYSPRL